jgi:predicted transcriptional regulator
MTTLTVRISDELGKRLAEIAEREGVPAEELAGIGLEDWISQPPDEFERIKRYLFKKNAELYRRLS